MILPIALLLATVGAVVIVSKSYTDSIHRWTAIGAILTGAALLAAVVGLPIALYQLFAVERDLAQLRLVPPGHFDQLRSLLESCQHSILRQVRIDFGDPRGGRKLFRVAFFAHFPQLKRPIEGWDAAVGRVESARASFANALEREADAAGVRQPRYDRDAILNRLKERSPPSLYLLLEEWPHGPVPVKGSQDGSVEVAGIRTTISVTRILTEDELEAMVRPIVELCEAARTLPEVKEVRVAQDALAKRMQPLMDGLKLYRATETVPIAERCPICRRNLAATTNREF